MASFTEIHQQLDWHQLVIQINSKSPKEVEKAICADRLSLNDFMALISPAAYPYLEVIAQKAQKLTRQRFGNIVSLYVPLYLSNLCANDCTYCGFSMHNPIKRKTLNETEIIAECEAIRSMGYNNLLLVTGEHPSKVGMNYFRQYIPLIRQYFSSLLMEVQPLTIAEYRELKKIGLDGVLVYQETYHQPTYQQHHLRGKKQDFFWRLETPDRLGQAGIDKIGLGALIGLSNNWRVDYYLVANHLFYLQKKYWKSRYSISFPRIRACIGGIKPASTIQEAELVQLICAFRLLAPEVELSLSTRESPFFRDNIIPLVINNLSAGSRTQPGGYAKHHQALEQFATYDNRSAKTIAKVIIDAGLQPVWKDWDNHLGR
ncbi:MAG TPA: 2-iminoacetate synthase ThiH [Arsenophonus apicola]